LRVTKVSHPQLATVFRDGVTITEATGKAVAEWAKGTSVVTKPDVPVNEERKGAIVKAVDGMIDSIRAAPHAETIDNILADDVVRNRVKWLLENMPEEHKRLYAAVNKHRASLQPAGTAPADP
jgi:hypothetical protein